MLRFCIFFVIFYMFRSLFFTHYMLHGILHIACYMLNIQCCLTYYTFGVWY